MINDLKVWMYSLFNPCCRYESLIVTEVYEGLRENEKAELMSHLKVCERCSRNYEEIIGFVAKIERVKEVMLNTKRDEKVDLWPEVAVRIRDRKTDSDNKVIVRWWIPISVGLSVAILLFVVGGYTIIKDMEFKVDRDVGREVNLAHNNMFGKSVSNDIPLERQKEKLMSIIQKNKGQDFAGEALLMLADIEYSTEEKYDEAHKLYSELRNSYPHIFSSSPQAIYRYNLLEEVSNEGYKPLYILNSSLTNVNDPIPQLEGIVKRYPGKLVAQLAVQKMLECYGDGNSLNPDKQIALLEKLRNSLSDPVVVAQVDYMLGDLYWKQKSNLKRAEELFKSVYSSGPSSLRPFAHDALVQLVSFSE